MTNTIAYFGEIDSNNIGDVAVYTALRECYSMGNRITPIPQGDAFMEPSLQISLDQYSSIMIGGGTQLTPMNVSYLKSMFQRHEKVWSFGTGVGSCGFCEEPEPDLSEITPFLRRMNPLTVRGPLSQKLLSRYRIHSRVIGDPALGYAKEHTLFRGGRKIWINLTPPLSTDERMQYQPYLANIARAITLLRAKGWQIQFLALGPGDHEYIDHFRSAFGLLDAEVAEIYTSAHDFFECLEEAALLFSMRLHGAVLASCAGVPFLLCNYRPKCRDFAASLGREDLLIDPSSTASDMMGNINRVFEESPRISSWIRSKALFFRELQANFLEAQLRG